MIVMAERERARDGLLVIRCQQGEPQAYEELVRAMERKLFYYIRRFVGNDENAADVLREVWLAVFEKVGKLRDGGASHAGQGPGRASACCGVPEAATAAVATATVAPATLPAATVVPEATPTPAATPDPACAQALGAEVLFATNSAELTAEGQALLDRLAPCWRGGRFEVGGYTDSSGTDAINEPLSEARARAVIDHLASGGIDRSALTARGYGSSKPVADNATAEGRALNRRVEFRKE
jgi:outer membrane protein OmpA-like peptidoglycan-associated protein